MIVKSIILNVLTFMVELTEPKPAGVYEMIETILPNGVKGSRLLEL